MPKGKRAVTPIKNVRYLGRQHAWLLFKLGLILAIFDGLLQFATQEPGSTAQGFLQVVGLTAFIWLARQIHQAKTVPATARAALYQGVGPLIKQFLILMLWVACLLPFIAGSLVYVQITEVAFAPTATEMVAAGALWLFMTLISFYLVMRTVFAAVLVHDVAPVEAVRRSWQMTRRRIWWLGQRILGALLITSVPSILIAYVTAAGLLTGLWAQAAALLSSALLYILILPVLALVIYQVYEYEKPSRAARRRAQT